MDRIDKKLSKLGFKKIEDTYQCITYEKYIKKYNYTHCIEIFYKSNGNHSIYSYQKGVNKDGYNNCVAIPAEVLKLIYKKYKKCRHSFENIKNYSKRR